MFCRLRLRYCHIESQRGKDIIRQSPAGLSMQRLRWSRVNIKGNHFESRCMSCFMNTTCTRLLFSSVLRWNCLHSRLKMRAGVRWGGWNGKSGGVGVPQATGGGRCGVFEKETINTEEDTEGDNSYPLASSSLRAEWKNTERWEEPVGVLLILGDNKDRRTWSSTLQPLSPLF